MQWADRLLTSNIWYNQSTSTVDNSITIYKVPNDKSIVFR